jgi:hypothetical protein
MEDGGLARYAIWKPICSKEIDSYSTPMPAQLDLPDQETVSDQDKGITIDTTGGQRNLVVDGLRGFCLVLMTINHILEPLGTRLSLFSNHIYGPFGFFTSASGFVFLSGWVAGRVYGKHRQVYGDWAVIRRILNRLRRIYFVQMALFFMLLFAVALHFHGTSSWHLDLFERSPLKAILLGATLLYTPEYLGILPMYCLFLLAAPVLLWQLQTGHTWRVVAWSAALWLISGLAIRLPADSFTDPGFAFNPFGYQLLFVIGLTLGERRVRLDSLNPFTQRWLILASIALTALFFVLRLEYAIVGSVREFIDHLQPLFSLQQMGPVRVLNFAAFGVLLTWIFQRTNWIKTDAAPFRWLILLGHNALPVFAWSILSTYAATAALVPHAPTSLRIAAPFLAALSLSIPALFFARRARIIPTAGSSSWYSPHHSRM